MKYVKIKRAVKLVESAVGDYAKLERGYAQFKRYFEQRSKKCKKL